MDKWDQRFLDLVALVATWSKDSTKVGCVIVGSGRSILSMGYNGLPRNVDDGVVDRMKRPTKYLYAEHAERNAVYNAARQGTILTGSTIYTNLFPCADCARAIVQTGINRVVTIKPDLTCPIWGPHFHASCNMFDEAGIKVCT